MTLVAVALAVAAVLGVRRGHSLAARRARPPRGVRLVVLAALLQVVGGLLGGRAYPVALALAALLTVRFLSRNRGRAGLPLVAAGLLLNAAAVLANGAMPVSATAARRAGVEVPTDARHERAGPSTRLRALTDVLPVPLPPRPEVASAGDALIAAGLGLYLYAGTRPRRRLSRTARPVGGSAHGKEVTQAQGPGEAQGQPRQASQLLTGGRSRPD